MITIEMLAALQEDDGLTLKNYKSVTYKTGYQVALRGLECRTAAEAVEAVNQFGGSCGVWYSQGIYYIDESIRVDTKAAALAIGRHCSQISILKWQDFSLIYC
mgnify:FL=1